MQSRHKESSFVGTFPRYTRTYCHSGNTDVEEVDGIDSIRYMRTDGFDIPDYRRRRAAGELLPHTPFDQIAIEGSGSSSPFVFDYDTGADCYKSEILPQWGFNPWYEGSNPSLNIDLKDAQIFVQQAAARINGHGHDTLTFLAELHKVRDMFNHALKRLYGLLTSPKMRRRLKNASWSDVVGAVSELWLEFRYGWRILYYDMLDINQALVELEDRRSRFSERAGMSYTEQVDLSYIQEVPGYLNNHVTIRESYEVSLRGSVTADLILSSPFQFNPVITAWELITFSFIVDWFITVGDALGASSMLATSSAHTASHGYRVHKTRSTSSEIENLYPGVSGYSGTHSGECTTVWTVRTPTTVSITPHLTNKLDEFKFLDVLTIIRGGRNKPRSGVRL